MKPEQAIELIIGEFARATELHGFMPTLHHGYATILEELDELWAEVKRKRPNTEELTKEVVQVGAMALRFLVDLIPEENHD